MNSNFVYTEEKWERLKSDYPLGTIFESRIVKKISPSLIVVAFFDGKNAILPLNNLGRNLAQCQSVYNKLNIGENEVFVITEFQDNNRIAIISRKEKFEFEDDSSEWDKYKLGDIVPGIIIDMLPSMALVRLSDAIFGILNFDDVENSKPKAGSNRNFKVIGKNISTNYLELKKITCQQKITTIEEDNNQIVDFAEIDSDMSSYQSFKLSNLRSFASITDMELLEKAFKKDEFLFSKAIKFPKSLHFAFQFFERSWEIQFKTQFIPYLGEDIKVEEALSYLENQKYWCSYNYSKSQQDEINIFNNEILLTGIVDFKDAFCKIKVSSFSFGNNEEWAGKKKNWLTRHGSFLLNGKVKFLSPFQLSPMDNSQKDNFNLIKNKTEAFEIYQKISNEQGAILKVEGRALEIFDKFLEYQADRNTKESYSNELYISGEYIKPVFNNDNEGIRIELDFVISNEQSGAIADDSMVKIYIASSDKSNTDIYGRQYIDHAKCYSSEQNTYLTFSKNINIEILREGFFVVPVISNSQFNVQRQIIQEFFNREIKIKHVEDLLLKPEKIIPPEYDKSFSLINLHLRQTEIDKPQNNQVKAVRKAVGNNNIFLIQGPPGTGKTTVIAEVIQQLIKRGEKVLVSSQTHIAVDNVLEKLSEIEGLNLLRIGSFNKLNDSIKRYHIDGWIKFYAEDYFRYSQNNLMFLNKLVNDNFNFKQEDIKEFKKSIVSEVAVNYHPKLKEQFKSRHHEFLDVILNLDKNELRQIEPILIDWINNVKVDEELAKSVVYNSVDVAFGTCIGIRTDRDFTEKAPKFNTVIIDEAGKANLSETFVPISMAKKVLLVGDQKQLPPYLDSSLLDENEKNSFPNSEFGKNFLKEEIEHALKTSFFEFLINKKKNKEFPEQNIEMLNYQHRMHPHIGEFVSQAFYGGELKMGDYTHQNRLELPFPFDKEIIFINTSSGEKPYESILGVSVQNKTEANCIANHLLPELIKFGVKPEELAIITPYSSQVQTIKKAISINQSLNSESFEVSTLDSFQGMEFDIIMFSFTRSASPQQKNRRVGFLDDARRLNVAFSRAKKKLILVGNAQTLTDKKSHFDYLFDYTGLFNILVHLSKDKNIGNFIELAEFADLLSPIKEYKKQFNIGDLVNAKYKSSNDFGHYFNLAPGVDGMVYDKQKYLKYEKDQSYCLELKKIDDVQNRIDLIDPSATADYVQNEIHWARYKNHIKSGHFFALPFQDIFVHDPELLSKHEQDVYYPIRIERVDKVNKKMSGKVIREGLFIKGKFVRKEGDYLIFRDLNYDFKVIRTQKKLYLEDKLYPFRIVEVNFEEQKLIAGE